MNRRCVLILVSFCCLLFARLGLNACSDPMYDETPERAEMLTVETLGEEIHVRGFTPSDEELFRVVILKNGGISELILSGYTYVHDGCWCLWNYEVGGPQTNASTVTAEPEIVEAGDYVFLRCFSRSNDFPLSMVSNITISKTGVIFVSSTLTAYENAPGVTMIAWGWFGLPESIFSGTKAYVNMEGTVHEVDLPLQTEQGGGLFNSGDAKVLWMDFSKQLHGFTMVNQDANLYESSVIWDQRPNGTIFSIEWKQADWGHGSMVKGHVKGAELAIILHGEGGHESVQDMIDLLTDIGKVQSRYGTWYESYKDDGALNLYSQARDYAESARRKISAGDITGAGDDATEALNLFAQAEEAEKTASLTRNIATYGVPVAVIVVIIVLIVMRRRKAKTLPHKSSPNF